MGIAKKESNTEVIYASLGLVGMGVVFSVIGPSIAAVGLCSMGGLSTAYFVYDSLHRAKEKEVFRKCGLTVDDVYPRILKKDKHGLHIQIPTGLSFSAFEGKKAVLETAFNCPIDLIQEDYNKLHIRFCYNKIPFSPPPKKQ